MIPFLLSALIQSSDLTLYRGVQLEGPFAGVKQRYWDVSEAEIDAAGPDSSIPVTFALTGNTQRKVFIRFGSLDIATTRASRIVDGTLTLTLADPEKTGLRSIKVVKRPWMTPGVSVLQRAIKPKDPKDIPFAAGVTWNKTGGDISNWQGAGANGRDDAEAIDAKITVANGEVKISNLGPTLQYWKTHEGENYGFLLEFSGETGIWSSTSPERRPRLDLKLEQSEVKDPHFAVTNESGSVSIQSTETIKSVDLYKGTKKLASEGNVKFALTADNPSKDPRSRLLRVVVTYEDKFVPQEVITLDPEAPWTKLSANGTRIWNKWTVDQSFYSFAKYGAQKYVNGEGTKDEELPVRTQLQPFENTSHFMDTMLISGLVPPARMTRNPLFRQMPNVEGGPLAMAQVDLLMNGKLQYPSAGVIGRIVNIDGRPLEGAVVGVTTTTSDTHDLKSDKDGYVFLPTFKPGTLGKVTITATLNGVTQTFTSDMTLFSNLYARGNTKAISVDFPFNLASWPISEDTNLASGKPTTDSAGSFPAQLVGLVDDSVDTQYTLPGKGWVEIDLGRDRSVGQITFQGSVPQRFKVLVYGTTDKIEQADWWIDEVDSARFKREYELTGDLTYRPTPNSARFIRIENLTNEPAKLSGIKVFAAKKPS